MDAQQIHDAEVADSKPRTKEQIEYTKVLLKSRRRLESEGWSGLVDDVAEDYGLTRERAIELIEEFGG